MTLKKYRLSGQFFFCLFNCVVIIGNLKLLLINNYNFSVTTKPKYKPKNHIEEESYENDHEYGRKTRKNTNDNSIKEDINDKYSKNYKKTYDFEGREGRKKGQDVEGYDNRFHKDEHYKVHRFYDDDYDNKEFKKGLKVFDDEDDDETFY